MGMINRLLLHDKLCEIVGSTDYRRCAFSPPPSIELRYPCIIYHKAGSKKIYADNIGYLMRDKYTVTVIDEDPDSEIASKVEALPLCTFDRHYYADGLSHSVFTIFF